MTFAIFDQNGTRTHFSAQSSKMNGSFDTVANAITHLEGVIEARKWTVIDMDVEADFADVAAYNGSTIHTFTIEAT